LIKLRKKETVTAAGIHIPTEVLAQDPTAQDIRVADVIKSNSDVVTVGATVIIEAFVGKGIYLDADKNLYVVCYGADIMAIIKD
jgi:co-chaperonin GroES (HSP10)